MDTASAARIESDRFLNPKMVVCPTWTGRDLSGRQVTADSFMTKTAGCASAEDRVMVENSLRPQYSEYINLDVNEGIRGKIYQDNMYYQNAGLRSQGLRDIKSVSGNFGGVVSGADRQFGCSSGKNYDAMENGVRQMNRQVARNKKQGKPAACKYRNDSQPSHHRQQPRQRENYQPRHNGQIVEGFTDERIVVASNDFYRKNAAMTSGYRSCRFTEASGF